MASYVSALDGDLTRLNRSLPDPVSVVDPAAAPTLADLRAPEITVKCLLHQFRVDVFGKEYRPPRLNPYTWMADQVGHVCLGIVGWTPIVRQPEPLVKVSPGRDAVSGP